MSVALLDPSPIAAFCELDPTHRQNAQAAQPAYTPGSLAALAYRVTEPLRALRPSEYHSNTSKWPSVYIASWENNKHYGFAVTAPTPEVALDMADAIAIILSANHRRVSPPQLVGLA